MGEMTTMMTMTLLCQRGWLEARSKRMPMTLSGKTKKKKKKKTEKRHERSKHLNRRMTTSESSMNRLLTAAESVVDLRHLVEYLFELLLLLLPLRLQLPVVFVYGAQLQ